MKLTQAYIRKLIIEELSNEQPTSEQAAITDKINQSAKTSPFIIMMNTAQSDSKNQLFILQQFLNKITIKDPTRFYTDLSNMALKLKDSKPQTANPVQPTAKPTIANGKPQ